jgi:hypothetical protein
VLKKLRRFHDDKRYDFLNFAARNFFLESSLFMTVGSVKENACGGRGSSAPPPGRGNQIPPRAGDLPAHPGIGHIWTCSGQVYSQPTGRT